MDNLFALLPLIPSIVLAFIIADASISRILFLSAGLSISCFVLSNTLIPIVAEYTLKKGLSGKDLGKRGTPNESKDIPEALGIVTGTTYLMAAIVSQLLYASNDQQKVIYNSALFSICFMIFLGFTDDVLDLKWRYKLVLPTIASLPLLSAYSGQTAIYIPPKLQALFMNGKNLTAIGELVSIFAVVDSEAHGAIIELGFWFLLFMGFLAVFCTNAINIYAGINGLEAGQSYIIAASILFFKLFEIYQGHTGDNQIFSIVMVMPFLGATLSLLRYNWFPSHVFVGDTFCYFAGMTFAVIGIHGHFSKTLLLLFLPQIINFLYSIPQLFKLLPCPRHRLPRIDAKTKLMNYSAFPCEVNQFTLFKVKKDATECPNCTLICLVLRITGPIHEKSLCLILLFIQLLSSLFTFFIRFYLLEEDK
jgi:UDP-N-acetylglucosamine--dolichyl-phosphate N-acetylglucosaminephosphotransferase